MRTPIALAVIFSAALAFAEVADLHVGSKVQLTPEQRAERRAKKRLQRMIKNGGKLIDMRAMTGVFKFVNCQGKVSLDGMKYMARRLHDSYNSNFDFAEMKDAFTIQSAPDALKKVEASAAVFVVDLPDYPTVLVAPETKWATVNVAALSADNPDKAKLERRVEKELSRAFAALVGHAAIDPLCVTKTATSLQELDAIQSTDVSSEVMVRIEEGLKANGVKPFRVSNFREACEEGWAPAPTNEYQKAILEEVKAGKERGPTNPIKIPDPVKK